MSDGSKVMALVEQVMKSDYANELKSLKVKSFKPQETSDIIRNSVAFHFEMGESNNTSNPVMDSEMKIVGHYSKLPLADQAMTDLIYQRSNNKNIVDYRLEPLLRDRIAELLHEKKDVEYTPQDKKERAWIEEMKGEITKDIKSLIEHGIGEAKEGKIPFSPPGLSSVKDIKIEGLAMTENKNAELGKLSPSSGGKGSPVELG